MRAAMDVHLAHRGRFRERVRQGVRHRRVRRRRCARGDRPGAGLPIPSHGGDRCCASGLPARTQRQFRIRAGRTLVGDHLLLFDSRVLNVQSKSTRNRRQRKARGASHGGSLDRRRAARRTLEVGGRESNDGGPTGVRCPRDSRRGVNNGDSGVHLDFGGVKVLYQAPPGTAAEIRIVLGASRTL